MMGVAVPERQDSMPTGPFPNEAVRLEHYLDGTMDPTGRAAFERDLASRPDLRAQVDFQDRIDDALQQNLGRTGSGAGRGGLRVRVT